MKTVLAASLISASALAQADTLTAQIPTYPKPHTVEQVDDYFGTKVADPYRWMENVDAPEVKQWVDAENLLTRAYLDAVPGRDAIKSRLMALTNYERFSAPTRYGTRYFYSHNTGLQNQAVLFWQEGLDRHPARPHRPQHPLRRRHRRPQRRQHHPRRHPDGLLPRRRRLRLGHLAHPRHRHRP